MDLVKNCLIFVSSFNLGLIQSEGWPKYRRVYPYQIKSFYSDMEKFRRDPDISTQENNFPFFPKLLGPVIIQLINPNLPFSSYGTF